MGVVAKRAAMTFFSDPKDHYSHRVRIVLAEKSVAVDVVDMDPQNLSAELQALNPYHSLPTLVDRELTIYESRVMMEYLDERFPHPPLLPVYPVTRAEIRQFIYRVETDWCPWVDTLTRGGSKDAVAIAKKDLRNTLVAIAPIFTDKAYFMSDEFTLVDCCLAPIFWRLPSLGVELPNNKKTAALYDYMKRVFERDSFQASLADAEKDMRAASGN